MKKCRLRYGCFSQREPAALKQQARRRQRQRQERGDAHDVEDEQQQVGAHFAAGGARRPQRLGAARGQRQSGEEERRPDQVGAGVGEGGPGLGEGVAHVRGIARLR